MVVHTWVVDEWVVCFRTDKWYYNSEPAATFRLTGTAPEGGLCGPGYYGLTNFSAMRDSGVWHGSNAPIWSGSHYLPAESLTTQPQGAAPPMPDWAKPGGEKPDTVKVADRNGDLVRTEDGKPFEIDFDMPAPTGGNGAKTGTTRATTTDDDGSVTETVVVEFVRPVP